MSITIESFDSFNEKKNWIKDAVKKPGSLRKSLGKKEGEKISKSEINSEIRALKRKDRDRKKSGIQGLKGKDLLKYRRLNLARTFKSMKENYESEESIKIYVVLYCFWEGDGYLVNQYEDCFLNKEEAVSFAESYDNKPIIYLPDQKTPDEGEGGYGSPSFIQIIEKEF